MNERGILHIKLFEYLLKKNNSFGYIQIKDFLLNNFEDEKNFKDRKKMSELLKFLSSENYIDIEPAKTYGIGLIIDAGHRITREEISCSVRIKPKAIELYNSYIYNKNNISSVNKTIIISGIAVLISAIGLFFPIKEKSIKDNLCINKYDSISKINQTLKNKYNKLHLKTQELKQQHKDK